MINRNRRKLLKALVIGSLAPNILFAVNKDKPTYDSDVEPDEAAKYPILKLKRGIAFDRVQSQGFPVGPGGHVTPNDIAIAKSMGFDHIKVLFTADAYISGAGLVMANMNFVDEVVNRVVASGVKCLVCIHPESKFKFDGLGSQSGFDQMLGFYGAFAAYLAARWKPDQIALHLMTEPFSNGVGGAEFEDWNIIYPQMVAAVRKHMPYYTLSTSGDKTGNIYGMTRMIPIKDDRLYYSFTTYEPYQFGFNAMFGGGGKFWKDISYVPWPVAPAIIQSRMEEMLSTVKTEDRAQAQKELEAYGAGNYNREWLDNRANEVKAWNDAHGGKLNIMVAEFGCLDEVQAGKFGASRGLYPKERIQFVKDLRESFEKVGMGWSYWSFNETFTALNPQTRVSNGPSITAQQVDQGILWALGLKH
jgi:Cellulase (glycosyl hydrolase family 5)